jgi:anti-sigma B factor antagonist
MDKIVIKTSFLEKSIPIVLVELGGYIDQSNCDKIQKVFDNLFSAGHFSTIFDFSKVIYMSSAGWGIFVGEVKRFRENNGDIRIVNMNAEIYEIFQMLEFYHILEDYNTIEEALVAYGIQIAESVTKEEKPSVPEKPLIPEKSPAPEQKGVPAADTTFLEKELQLFEQPKIISQERPVKLTPEKKINPFRIKKPGDNHRDEKVKEIELDITQLPVEEKIRKLVGQFPLLSLRQMKKMLRHEDFGREKVGRIKLYRLLKELNLENKAKRYRYYRSC